MCPSAPRVCSEPGGQKPVLSLSLDRIPIPELELELLSIPIPIPELTPTLFANSIFKWIFVHDNVSITKISMKCVSKGGSNC